MACLSSSCNSVVSLHDCDSQLTCRQVADLEDDNKLLQELVTRLLYTCVTSYTNINLVQLVNKQWENLQLKPYFKVICKFLWN